MKPEPEHDQKLKLRNRVQRKAEADIRRSIREEQELQLEYPEIHILRWQDNNEYVPLRTLEVTAEEIRYAARLLVAFSRVGVEGFGRRDWQPHLDAPMNRDEVYLGFSLLEKLKLAYCDPYEDPYDRGTVWVGRGTLNRYAA
jgi:hypothetical protein